MATHRLPPARRRAEPRRRGARRATVRRTGRSALLGLALALTVVTGASGLNLLSAGAAGPSIDPAASVEKVTSTADRIASAADDAAPDTPAPEPSSAPERAKKPRADTQRPASLPKDSGSGRRVVFDISEQRVWLVGANGKVRRTYLASGSIHDNLDPGSYEVYSRSRNATSYDYSSTMEYFVRFTRGDNAAIGFHQIPVTSDGEPVQTRQELGKPTSSGCIRQRPADAKAMWAFAPIGTPVVVTA